jgi:hypothetical protein
MSRVFFSVGMATPFSEQQTLCSSTINLPTTSRMSLEEINELRRRLDEAERRQVEEQRLREEEQRLREEEQRRREEAEHQLRLQTQGTTLPEFLNACHEHLFLGLIIQKDKASSTKGDPANADRKLRPEKIQEWTDFPQEQVMIWDKIMDADFVTKRHFTPLLAITESGKEVRQRMMSSELDLGYFQRHTVESRVASVIKQLFDDPRLRQTFHLNGDVTFENHANTLTDEPEIVSEMSSLSLTQEQPRRSKRLAAKRSDKAGQSASPPPRNRATQPRPSRPRADQFCVYNRGVEDKVPAFIIEYKAPHKLSLAHIKAGLGDMELDPVIRYQPHEKPEDICRRVVAAVITQLFSYMVQGGLEYGSVCTGEASIYLRVPRDDPSTVYYYLSVPKEDVGDSTGWTDGLDGDNRLHLTSLGQSLAFTLRALRTQPRDTGWINWARSQLQTWEMVYDDLLEEISEKEIPFSDYKPSPQNRNEYCRVSPVRTRSKSAISTSCHPPQGPLVPDHDDSGDGFDPNTPSRMPRSSRFPSQSISQSAVSRKSQDSSYTGKSRQYCTQRCLRGLLTGGILDKKCPNVLDHGGTNRHRLNQMTLIHLLDQQLSADCLGPDSQLGCESLHIHGTRGALFKVTLWSHGYTFVGKGVPVEFIECSRREASVYSRLTSIQGVSVPVLLGSLDLRRPFSYDGIAHMVHFMFMSFVGRTLAKRHDIDQNHLIQQAGESLHIIHQLGVLHSDPIPGNMAWNEEYGRVMFIDFERAKIQHNRMPLRIVSPNKKRKRKANIWDESPKKCLSHFEQEIRRMRCGLES